VPLDARIEYMYDLAAQLRALVRGGAIGPRPAPDDLAAALAQLMNLADALCVQVQFSNFENAERATAVLQAALAELTACSAGNALMEKIKGHIEAMRMLLPPHVPDANLPTLFGG
jgi:hypothetical protein